MSNERLNSALQSLSNSAVNPELISDEMITGLPTHRSTVTWWLAALGVVAVIGVGVWMNREMHDHNQDAVHTLHSMSGAVGLGADQQLPAAGVTTSDSARSLNDESLDALDPNSILVLNLSDQELAKLGISRNNDTVYVTMQSLVVDDTSIAKKLGLEPATLRDSSALFHWRCSATPTGVDHIVPTSFDGTRLDHLVPFWAQSIDSNNRLAYVRYIQQAILDKRTRDEEIMTEILELMNSVSVDSLEYEAHVPNNILPRDRKPIIVQVHNRQARQRVAILYMPTDRFIARMPARFLDAIRFCYDTFQPKVPKPYVHPKATPRPEANLIKVEGVVGQPFVELTDDQLVRFGIARDSVTVFHHSAGATLDTMLTSYRRFETIKDHANSSPFTQFHYRNGVIYLSKDGVERSTAIQRWYPIATLATAEAEGVNGVSAEKTRSTSIAYRIVSGTKTGWYADFPHASELAEKVAITLGNRGIPLDSLAYYWVVENGVSVPVTRLLIPIRVSTPWVTSIRFATSPRRLTHVYWYLPTKEVTDSLPEELATFLKPEYEAVMRSIEDKLSAAELCSLLDRPSAFGLCSIGDTTLRIDGVGPIPARESFTVFLQCSLATTATVKLISDDGRTVIERSQISLVKGANQIPIQLAGQNIPQGAYTVVVSCAEGTRTSRVLLATQ